MKSSGQCDICLWLIIDKFPKALLCLMVLDFISTSTAHCNCVFCCWFFLHTYVTAIQYATTKTIHCKGNRWRTTVVFNNYTVNVCVLNHINPIKWQWGTQKYPHLPNEDVSLSLVPKRERGKRTAKSRFTAASPGGLPPAQTLNLA